MLTKKHFQQLARIVAEHELRQLIEKQRLRSEIAAMCRHDNPSFNAFKFYEFIDAKVAKAIDDAQD